MRPAKDSPANAAPGERYSTVAIVLHWLIAATIMLQLTLGWRMHDLAGDARAAILQIHKSVGITILILCVARLAWRLLNPPPSAPPSVTRLERRLAAWIHRGLYAAMIALPLTGWAMISGTRRGETLVFGLVPWPRLPLVSLLPPAAREVVTSLSDTGHMALVWLMLAMLALHIAGALKHQFVSRDTVLSRMAPGFRPGLEPRLLAVPIAAALAAALAVAPKPPPPAPPRPKPVRLASADIYLDIVGPALKKRCASCHNDDRSKGGLSVASYEALSAGGADGVVIHPGAPATSELYRRVTLPSTHAHYMPKDGRTPLTPDQVQAIRWWISIGAPGSGAVGLLKVSDTARPMLERALKLDASSGGGGAARIEALPSVPKGEDSAIAALEQSGFAVRPAAAGSNLLDVNRYARTPVTDTDIANLSKLQQQIRILILRKSGVTDAQLRTIGRMPNLVGLRLEQNPITDAGVSSLAGLKNLRLIDLYGTRATDAALITLAALPRLERVYAWNTGMTKAAADRLKTTNPRLTVETEGAPSPAL